jgi:serine/threonine protein kinase
MKYHRNVIEFLHYEQVSAEHFVIICERPANCKDLYDARSDRGGIFMEHEAKRYAKMLVDVTLAMEKKGIVHRDYKLENIIYDPAEDTIKVIDFGMAIEHKPGKLHQNFCGEY